MTDNSQMPFPLSQSIREEFEMQLNHLRRLTNHGPSIGRYIELSLIRLFRKYLPTKLEFTSGFVQPMNPKVQTASPQLDIICYDRLNYPLLLDIDEIKVVTPASVRAIIEVKSSLTTQAIGELLSLGESESLHEVPPYSRLFLLATNSKLTPKAAFRQIVRYYDKKPHFSKFLGGIMSLDWDEMIIFPVNESGTEIDYRVVRIWAADFGLSIMLGYMIAVIFGHKEAMSIANKLAPAYLRPREERQFKLYTREGGVFSKHTNAA